MIMRYNKTADHLFHVPKALVFLYWWQQWESFHILSQLYQTVDVMLLCG